nr:MAG: internal scaffolding protein [Microvirus sp.]
METIARAQYDERKQMVSDLSFEGDKGVTKQADLKDCDINAIFKRFEKTGQLPDMIVRDGHYGDYSNVPDYQEALNIVSHANEQFLNLDADLRNRFDNDPAKFLEFATDPKNIEEMEKLGLLNDEAKARLKAERDERAAVAAAAREAEKAQAEKDLIAKIKAELNK